MPPRIDLCSSGMLEEDSERSIQLVSGGLDRCQWYQVLVRAALECNAVLIQGAVLKLCGLWLLSRDDKAMDRNCSPVYVTLPIMIALHNMPPNATNAGQWGMGVTRYRSRPLLSVELLRIELILPGPLTF